MEIIRTNDRYPVRIIILSNLVSFSIYGIGFMITLRAGWIPAVLYLGFILAFEYRLISSHCTNCYYWGKACGFGKGRLSSLFFKKGDPAKFCNNKMSWKDLIPDLLITLVPLVIGIVLIIIRFDFIILFALVVLLLF